MIEIENSVGKIGKGEFDLSSIDMFIPYILSKDML